MQNIIDFGLIANGTLKKTLKKPVEEENPSDAFMVATKDIGSLRKQISARGETFYYDEEREVSVWTIQDVDILDHEEKNQPSTPMASTMVIYDDLSSDGEADANWEIDFFLPTKKAYKRSANKNYDRGTVVHYDTPSDSEDDMHFKLD